MARTAASITIQQIPVITLFFFGIQNAIAARGQHAVAATGCVANIGILFACIAEFHTRIQHTVTALRHNNRKETFGCAIHTLFSVSGFSRITLFAKTCLHLSITAEAAFQLALCAAAIAAFHIAVITFFFFEIQYPVSAHCFRWSPQRTHRRFICYSGIVPRLIFRPKNLSYKDKR
jgi:hypothetical protein